MALEQAILELAAGMKEMAAAIRSAVGARGVEVTAQLESTQLSTETTAETGATKAAEPEKKEDTKAESEPAASDKTADVIKAVSDEIETKGTVMSDGDIAALDYAKDVRPVLLAAIKKAGKETVAAVLKKFGVDKADQLKVEQLPAVLAEAQKLVA